MKQNLHKKKTSIVDKALTVVLVAFAVGLIAVIAFTVAGSRKEESKGDEKEIVEASATPEVTEEPDQEEDLERYSCVLAEENKKTDTEASDITLVLNTRKGTFKQCLNSGDETSELDHGTYVKNDSYIELTNKKDTKSKLLYDGNFLVSENAIYEGKIPNKAKFNKVVTHKVDGVSSIRIEFKKNGKYTQEIVRSSSSSSEGQTNKTKGTYVKKGNFIERKKEDGTKQMSLYVYKNKICASYYEAVK